MCSPVRHNGLLFYVDGGGIVSCVDTKTGEAFYRVRIAGKFSASPILAGDSVLILIDQMQGSYIAAYAKSNGEMRWKVAREESEGWALAQAVHDRDDYDVEAYNLVTLRETMAKYAALRNDDFVVRLSTREAEIYGPRVLALLTKAKKTLATKYGIELARPTYVEIFDKPEQS